MSVQQLNCVFAQENFHVGDFEGNGNKIIRASQAAYEVHQARLVIFSELAISAYPPEDLLLRPSLKARIDKQITKICQASLAWDIYIVLGYPELSTQGLFNSALVIYQGKAIANYRKQCLPNYQVFDEKRYFSAGNESCVFEIDGVPLALTICEDIWFEQPAQKAKASGALALININASPFHLGKMQERKAILAKRSQALNLPILYAHCVGGQDELIFDGGSMVYNAEGQCVLEAPRFETALTAFTLMFEQGLVRVLHQHKQSPVMPELEEVKQALVMGVRDYVNKNGFKGVVLGLSGGIDSALTLALACEALGNNKVEAIMMPFRYTSQMSQDDAALQANNLGVRYQSIAIEKIYTAFMASLADEFAGTKPDTTEENLQARCRGVILMAISNKKGYLVLTTGNKSEMAVGYSTLYGDMAGGFDVLKDVPKTMVFRLCNYINEQAGKEIIPKRVIDRPPSAELAPDQKDEDSLPPYEILDAILALYVEQDQSAEAIIAKGFARDVVYKVLRLVDVNEYKRRQAPIGTRITARAFGKDRRYPITNAWSLGE